MKTRIHVNQHVIRANVKHGRDDPCITVKQGKSNRYTKHVEIRCCDCEEVVAEVIQSIDNPLSCGARIWIEVDGAVGVSLEEKE